MATTTTPADDARTTVLGPALANIVRDAKLLVVGAGGIGCELLKDLVLTGKRQSSVPPTHPPHSNPSTHSYLQ